MDETHDPKDDKPVDRALAAKLARMCFRIFPNDQPACRLFAAHAAQEVTVETTALDFPTHKLTLLTERQRQAVESVRRANGNVSQAARELGITFGSLRCRLQGALMRVYDEAPPAVATAKVAIQFSQFGSIAIAQATPPSSEFSPQGTLSEFFEEYIVPICFPSGHAPTVKEYRITLRHWARATGEPALIQIDDFTVARFRAWLEGRRRFGEPLSSATIRKHLVNLQFLLDRAGPRRDRGKPGANILQEVPWVAKPALVASEVDDVFTLEEIAAFWAACKFAKSPQPAPTAWWRNLVLFTYNTGLRLGTLTALRWEWLKPDELGTWLHIPKEAMKMKRPFRCYVNAYAEEILQGMERRGPLMFPWGCGTNWLHSCRRSILMNSTLPPGRRFGFHAIRKCLATELGAINPLAASIQLDHQQLAGSSRITRDHYTHRRIVVAAMNNIPQPELQEAPDLATPANAAADVPVVWDNVLRVI